MNQLYIIWGEQEELSSAAACPFTAIDYGTTIATLVSVSTFRRVARLANDDRQGRGDV
jgi:hypothetical protein